MDSQSFTPTISFNVIVSGCVVTTFTAPTSPSTIVEYTIGAASNSANTLTIAAWTQTNGSGAACTHTETLSYSPLLSSVSWLDATGRTVTASTADADMATTTL